MDALYNYVITHSDLSVLNALLVGLVFVLARHRWLSMLADIRLLQRQVRENRHTMLVYGLKIEREL